MDKDTRHNDVYLAALAGLLHDVGKFLGWGSVKNNHQDQEGYKYPEYAQVFVDTYVPESFRAKLGLAYDLNRSDKAPTEKSELQILNHIVRLSSRWAAGEDIFKSQTRSDVDVISLSPILSHLRLVNGPAVEYPRHRVQKLALTQTALFSEDSLAENFLAQCETLWHDEMKPELEVWKYSNGWAAQNLETYFTTLLSFFQKYFTFVPFAESISTDGDAGIGLDVSLYDYLKVTAAISACLRAEFSDSEIMDLTDKESGPVMMLVRGDLSGIQDFIYRIVRPDGERTFREAARRLRGRSFYLTLLDEAVAYWFIQRLELTPANLLFCGGGRFDILVPCNASARTQIEQMQLQLERWLLREFQGELAVAITYKQVCPQDFSDMRQVYVELESALADQKERKWRHQLTTEFLVSDKDEWDACPVCQLQTSEGVCEQCSLQAEIGRLLPHIDYLAFLSVDSQIDELNDKCIRVEFDFDEQMPLAIVLLTGEAALQILPNLSAGSVYQFNQTDFYSDLWSHLGQGFRLLAKIVPFVKESSDSLKLPGRDNADAAHPGNGLDFSEIAYLSTGSQKLGILKADVDHLGLLFSEGIEPLTLARLATLSSAIERFFSGYINVLAHDVFQKWQQEGDGKTHPWRDKISDLFYVAYAGGDDLFVIGPWNMVIRLAQRLEKDWRKYTCNNPDVTLSAGIILAKPHHPIQRMATAVSEAEKKAKDAGRNRITLFGETIEWLGDFSGLEWALKKACAMRTDVEEHVFPRTLVHDLGRLQRYEYKTQDGEEKPLWHPHLYYTLARRLGEKSRDKWLQAILVALTKGTLSIITSYVSLITRRD